MMNVLCASNWTLTTGLVTFMLSIYFTTKNFFSFSPSRVYSLNMPCGSQICTPFT